LPDADQDLDKAKLNVIIPYPTVVCENFSLFFFLVFFLSSLQNHRKLLLFSLNYENAGEIEISSIAEIKLPPGAAAVITAPDPAPDPYFFLIKDLNKFY
jgi:hypothetical protein